MAIASLSIAITISARYEPLTKAVERSYSVCIIHYRYSSYGPTSVIIKREHELVGEGV